MMCLNSNQTSVSVHKLRKTYDGRNYVLDGIELELYPGDMAVIEGKSGSGKSTLLNIIGLLDDYDEGEMFICGKRVEHNQHGITEAIRAERIGFVFQAYHLVEMLTVKENVMLPFLYCKMPLDAAVRQRFDEIVESLQLTSLIEKRASLLSGGEKQRVAIARAIIKEPDIIIADEPTGNLDFENTKMVVDVFRKLRKTGKTVLMVTHDTKIATAEDKRFRIQGGKLLRC